MSVANLQNVPRTPEQFAIFSFANQTSHLLITRAIFNKFGIVVPLPALDPIPQFALLTWGEQHAALHSLQNSILNLSNSDFSDVNLNDPAQLESWIGLHWVDHQTAESVLGVS